MACPGAGHGETQRRRDSRRAGCVTPDEPAAGRDAYAAESRSPSDGRALVPVPGPTTPATATRLNLPFNVGEQLNYQVFLGQPAEAVGSASFSVAARGRYFNRDGLLLTATAQTTNAGARVFYVNDKFSSYVDPETLLPFRTEMNFAGRQWRSTRGYNIDQNRGAVTTDTKTRIEIPVGTHDLISLLYAIRTFDLSPPSTSFFTAKAKRDFYSRDQSAAHSVCHRAEARND